MKLLLTCFLTFFALFSLQAEEKKVLIPDNLKVDYWKFRATSARLTDQFKQLQLAQQDIAKQFADLQPTAQAKLKELGAFCEAHKSKLVETVDEVSCEEKKEETKPKEDKK